MSIARSAHCTCPGGPNRAVHIRTDCPLYGDFSTLAKVLSENIVLKPYFDAGHVFNDPTGKCVRCGAWAIDLAEDMVYGPVRQCIPKETKNCGICQCVLNTPDPLTQDC